MIWSSVFIAIKVGLDDSSPAAFTVLRVVVAMAALGPILALSPRHRTALRSLPAHRAGVVLGLSVIAGFMILQTVGLDSADVGVAAVLIYVQPFLVAIGAVPLLRETLSVRQGLGLVAGWGGVLLIVVRELDFGGTPLHAILVLLAAAGCWAFGTLAFRAIDTPASPLLIVFLACLYGLPALLVFAALSDARVVWTSELVLMSSWAGVGGIVLGFGLQFTLLRRGKAGVVSSWIFPVPVLAGFLGVLLLGEAPRMELALGASAVALGIYLVNASGKQHGPSAVAEPD